MIKPLSSFFGRDFRISNSTYGADISISNSGPVIMAYDSMSSAGPLKGRKGWGIDYLKKLGFNVVSFMETESTAWFRRPEFQEVLQTVLDEVPLGEFSQRISYGGSMGGYAAGAFSGVLGADAAILFNPISTLNSDLVPWEDRYKRPAQMDWTGPYHDAPTGCAGVSRVFLVADPLFFYDRQHALRFVAANQRTIFYKLPGVGHSMPVHMAKLRVLGWFTQAIFVGGLPDPMRFSQEVRARRDYDGYYLWMLSRQNRHLRRSSALLIAQRYLSLLEARGVMREEAMKVVDASMLPRFKPLLQELL